MAKQYKNLFDFSKIEETKQIEKRTEEMRPLYKPPVPKIKPAVAKKEPIKPIVETKPKELFSKVQDTQRTLVSPTFQEGFESAGGGFVESASLGLIPQLMEQEQREKIEASMKKRPVLATAGQIGGYLLPGAQATKLAKPLVKGIAKPLFKIAAEGAITGAGMELAEGVIRQETPEEIAKRVALGTTLGAAGDVGMYGIGKGIKALRGIKAPEIKTPSVKTPEVKTPDIKQYVPEGSKVANVLVDIPKKSPIPKKEQFLKGWQAIVTNDLPAERIGKTFPDVAIKSNVLRKVPGSVDFNLEKAATDIEGNEIGESLFDILKNIRKDEIGDYSNYKFHKHNIARMAQNKPVFGSDVTADISADIISKMDQNPNFSATSDKITNYIDGIMQGWAKKSGLVNDDTLKLLKEMYPDYVPTYRVKDADKVIGAGSAKGNVSNIIKKAKGSSEDILPLDQQLATFTNKIIRASRKNEYYNAWQDAFDAFPEQTSRFFKPIKTEKETLADGVESIVNAFEEPIKKVGNTYELNFYRNGEKVKAQISEDLYNAIKSTNEMDDMGKVLDTVKKYGTTPFKNLITTYNPLFVVRNIMRDVPTALIYSDNPKLWAKNMPKAFKEIASDGKSWREYQSLGGSRSGIFSYDKPVKVPYAGTESKATKAAKGVLNSVETVNNMTEALPRFAEYLATVEKGGGTYESKLLGILRASEITTDFSRGGRLAKQSDAVVPYLNASIQGIDRFRRQVAEKPIQTALRGGAVMTVPTVILDQINKNNSDYNQLTEREKNNNYLIPGEDGKFIRIPKSREVGVVFSTLFEWLARSSRGEKLDTKEILSTVSENFSPVNPVENNLFVPLIKALDQYANPEKQVTDYAGRDIVPISLRRLETKEQYDQYTSEVAKAIGSVAGLSPKVTDYLIRSYTGVIGQTALPKTSASKRGAFESAFITDPVFKSKKQNEFYDLLNATDKKYKTLREREDSPTFEQDVLKKKLSELNKVSKKMSDVRKEQKAIDAMGQLSEKDKEDRIRRLQERLNFFAEEAVKQHGNK